jgi:transcriptional regulator with XRE-family HTH domain
VNAASAIRTARRRAGLSLRQLAELAETSHSAVAAYESGRTVPNVDTFDRVIRATGFVPEFAFRPSVASGRGARVARGRELVEALELAAMFPARHATTLRYPPFGRSS